MEVRYMGFTQNANTRVYRFERSEKTLGSAEIAMSVDMSFFTKHHVSIQEGPAMCLRKLNLEADLPLQAELTEADISSFADAHLAAAAHKAHLRATQRR